MITSPFLYHDTPPLRKNIKTTNLHPKAVEKSKLKFQGGDSFFANPNSTSPKSNQEIVKITADTLLHASGHFVKEIETVLPFVSGVKFAFQVAGKVRHVIDKDYYSNLGDAYKDFYKYPGSGKLERIIAVESKRSKFQAEEFWEAAATHQYEALKTIGRSPANFTSRITNSAEETIGLQGTAFSAAMLFRDPYSLISRGARARLSVLRNFDADTAIEIGRIFQKNTYKEDPYLKNYYKSLLSIAFVRFALAKSEKDIDNCWVPAQRYYSLDKEAENVKKIIQAINQDFITKNKYSPSDFAFEKESGFGCYVSYDHYSEPLGATRYALPGAIKIPDCSRPHLTVKIPYFYDLNSVLFNANAEIDKTLLSKQPFYIAQVTSTPLPEYDIHHSSILSKEAFPVRTPIYSNMSKSEYIKELKDLGSRFSTEGNQGHRYYGGLPNLALAEELEKT